MKILFTGGGSGGHFYPIISIAQEINRLSKENRLLAPELYFMSPQPYDAGVLFDNNIIYKKNSAGKVRRYFSILNFFDVFKTIWGVLQSILDIYFIYPDVVFGKGGYASFPALFAARFLRIPVVIHESDTVPGKVNKWAGKFAQRIAVSYPEAAEFFPKDKVAYTGNPIRQELAMPLKEGAFDFLKLESGVPVILVLGGSLGSQIINDTIIDAIPTLVKNYQIIHQTGKRNLRDVIGRTSAMLLNNPHKSRYKAYDYLDVLAMRMAAGAANVIVSRAGSAIFEIASWGVPSVLIPITDSNGDHQRKNAFAYARSGACLVIEELNLTPNILVSEVQRILDNPEVSEKMRNSANAFIKRDASELIAKEILGIALKHEK
ncbi:MAG: UDP-N-acetylglucosamine--N-acetylmuramyl-(pentapeptide) pyrophosphoryl-undecaprenol N-acetylglucosamine transferase [Candidatus Paceibacterota bacterium]